MYLEKESILEINKKYPFLKLTVACGWRTFRLRDQKMVDDRYEINSKLLLIQFALAKSQLCSSLILIRR